MAGPIQAGDIVAFGKLAWEVYQNGFTEEANATKQYTEFGRDVRGLAENLDILTDVVGRARQSLQSQAGPYNTIVRWDGYSLKEIVGDYDATLQECYDLIRANNRLAMGTNVLRNLEWNALVQPNADRLRRRIMLHNSKIAHFLKPFEIDLLCRVREDIQRLHSDLANRIVAVHYDIHRLMGVLVPDLETELSQQVHRHIYLLDVPDTVAESFRFAALTDRPEYVNDESFEISELSDAFVFNFQKSTKNFQSGIRVAEKIPPLEQYLNLLKCVWLLEKIRRGVPETSDTDSHWPSYVKQLEDDLSLECTRFKRGLIKPEMMPNIRRDMFSIWPDREPPQLVDVVTRDEMMEQVLEAPLQSSDINVKRDVKLLRRMGSDGKRYRILISGSEQAAPRKPRTQNEVIDFDLASAVISPHYAMPTSRGLDKEIILQRDERIARLSFTSLKNALKFQQAVTGFKAWNSYCEYGVLASFVVAGIKDPIVEMACVQLWIPKPVDGSLVTNTDVTPETNSDYGFSRSGTMATVLTGGGSERHGKRRDEPVTAGEAQSAPRGIPTVQRQGRSATVFSTSWPRQSSPGPIGSSPPRQSNMIPAVHQPSLPLTGGSPPGPRASPISRKPVPTTVHGSPPRPGTLATSSGSSINQPTQSHRTLSMSSGMSGAASANNSSSSTESHRVTVSTGSNTTGYLLRRPPKPRLVLFTQNQKDNRVSFVSIEIDDETAINAERCHCRRAGRDGGSACRITGIERQNGSANLEARRYEASQSKREMDWNLARLAENGAASDTDTAWPSLKRVSLMFPTAEGRATFGGMPNECQCKNRNEGELKECLRLGHRGLFGEVQEFHRVQANGYHRTRYEGHNQVDHGLMS